MSDWDERALRALVESATGRPLTDTDWRNEYAFYQSLQDREEPLYGVHPFAIAERRLAALEPLIEERVRARADRLSAENEELRDLTRRLFDEKRDISAKLAGARMMVNQQKRHRSDP